MRPCSSTLALCLFLPLLALAQAGQQRPTPAQLRERERQARILSEQSKKFAAQREKEKKDTKPVEPKPTNCKLPTPKRSAQFSEEALPGIPAADRYALYVGACGLEDVVQLAQQLVRFKTVSAGEPPA